MKQLGIVTSVDGESVSTQLRPLLELVYDEIARRPPDLISLKTSLEKLLSYLSTSEGRTNANCCATDHFFLLKEGWEARWDHLPASFKDILSDIGGVLHDAVKVPQIAENFESTPEQLLERLRSINTEKKS